MKKRFIGQIKKPNLIPLEKNTKNSLGVGGQYGPQLREIKLNTGEAVNVNSWRFPMAFFTIDVPFFNLHTGARKIIVD